jgi:hypothetical protein
LLPHPAIKHHSGAQTSPRRSGATGDEEINPVAQHGKDETHAPRNAVPP